MDVISFNKQQQLRYQARTGILVDIQNIGKNTQLLAQKVSTFLEKIRPGVWLRTDAITFPDGNFTNVYDIFWQPYQRGIVPFIHSSDTPYYLLDQMKQDKSLIAAINGAFFFLTDIAHRYPKELPYNFCVREGKLIGLPSSDQPTLYMQAGVLKTREVKAKGIIKINTQRLSWTGAQTKAAKRASVVLYNSKCCDVVKYRDPKTNIQVGELDNVHIYTRAGKQYTDIVVNTNRKGQLIVSAVRKGGHTHYFAGVFVLQCKGNVSRIKKGDVVEPLTLDGIDLQTVSSGMTIGRRVDDPYFLDPSRIHRRDARSIIAQDVKGNYHFMIFDGSKYIPGFNGVSAKDIRPIFAKDKFKWAYFLDGGGSSRIIVRDRGQLRCLANEFVFQKLKNGKFVWDWEKGRIVASSIALRVIEQ